jgi:hypothetical protein
VSTWDLLHYWDGELSVDPPQKTFEDEEGNWVALWWWPAQEWEWDGKKNNLRVLDIPAGVERVTFTPETFRIELFEDVMERYADDPPLDENDEPYYTEWGQEYAHQAVEFDRNALANFLKDVITGRLVRKKFHSKYMRRGGYVEGRGWVSDELVPVTYTHHRWVPAGKTMFLETRKLPRTREEMAQWVKTVGLDAIHNGSGDLDYIYELPEGVPERL